MPRVNKRKQQYSHGSHTPGLLQLVLLFLVELYFISLAIESWVEVEELERIWFIADLLQTRFAVFDQKFVWKMT